MPEPENDFVVQQEHWGHGNTTFHVISTRAHMTELVASLTTALAAPPASLRRAEDPPNSPLRLRHDTVTLAGRATTRVSLCFELAEDLGRYHALQRSNRWSCLLLGLVALVIVYFAWVGVTTVISGP